MERLKRKEVNLLNALYEYEKVDIALGQRLISEENVDHYFEYVDEYQERPIVYLSVHKNASSELVNNIAAQLIDNLDCVVRYYNPLVKKYDSYDVKNADLVIVFPQDFDGKYILGKGTETECGIAVKHSSSLMMCIEPNIVMDILNIEKTEIGAGAKVDWLNTATITETSKGYLLNGIIKGIKKELAGNPRQIYFKEKGVKAI